MKTKSIYLNNDYSKVHTPSDWIGAYGAELDTIERLLPMGFVFCNHVRLIDRRNELEAEIERQKELRKLEGKGFFAPVFLGEFV